MAKGKAKGRGAKVKRPTRVAPKPRVSAAEADRRILKAESDARIRRGERTKLQAQLAGVLEKMQDASPNQVTLRIASPSRSGQEQEGKQSYVGRGKYGQPVYDVHGASTGKLQWRTPWVIVGRFRFSESVGYEDLYRTLSAWGTSRIGRSVNPDRVSRLRLVYLTAGGHQEEYTLAETGPWQLALARAKQECDPEDTETSHPGGGRGSLAARYGATRILSLDVWLSDQIGFRRVKLAR
jgi:hypothetical protein